MGGMQRWLARVPLAGMALGCLIGVLAAEAGVAWWIWLVVPAVAGSWAWRVGSVPGVLACLAMVGWWGLHGARLDRMEALETRLPPGMRFEGEVVVREVREPGRFHPEVVAEVRSGAGSGGRIGLWNVPEPVLPGDRLRLAGESRHLESPRNPGEDDRLAWRQRQGLGGELWVERMEPLDRWSPALAPRRAAWLLRGHVRERLGWGLDPDGTEVALIRALVLGERDQSQVEAFAAFRHSGTMHVFAVSGLHVGMIGLLAWGLLRLLRVPRAWGVWAVVLVMWGYALVTGLRPPAMRAALMGTVFLAGFAVRRDPALGNALLASLPLVLLADSFQWAQPGFQLSYLVVASIILVAPPCYRVLRPVLQGDPFLPRSLYTRRQEWARLCREKVGSLGVVSFAAWLGSLPLMWGHFGLVTPAAVLASLVLVPVVFLILAVALTGLLAGLVAPPLEAHLNRANAGLVAGAHAGARGFAALPGSHFELGEDRWWREGLVVFDLRDGDGGAYFGGDHGVLLDTGGRDEFWRVTYPALRQTASLPQAMVISHPDGGHCGGGPAALRAWPVRQVLLPVPEALSPAYRELQEAGAEAGIPLLQAEEGRRYPLSPEAELEVLYAPRPGVGSLADDRCLVLRLHWNGWRILLTGDAGFETEQRLLERGADLQSDVWIMGRNAGDFTGTGPFLKAVGPAVVVASHRRFPVEERIPDDWAAAVTGSGVSLWRQDETGAVALSATKGQLELRSFLGGRREVLNRQ